MDNWENNIIAKKINSLQDLPEGYTPNLASKWEIIEAGLPKEKRFLPLFKWTIAAAAIIGVILFNWHIKSPVNKKEIVLQLQSIKKPGAAIAKAPVIYLPKTTDNLSIHLTTIKNNIPATVTTSIKTATTSIKQTPTNTPHKNLIITDTIPTLINTQYHVASIAISATSATPTLVTVNNIEINKPVKHKIYQKDFNDNQLMIDPANTALQNKQMGLKIQFVKHAASNNEPSPPVLQWQKNF